MAIQVEFFGIPRARAGVACATTMEGRSAATLAEVLTDVADRFPEFAADCMVEQGKLREGFVVSVDGQCFVSNDQVTITQGQSVLILSADAGG